MRRLLLGVGLTVLGAINPANADIVSKTSLMPENGMRISFMAKTLNGMTEQRFNELIQRVEKVYAPIVAQKGGTLKVIRNWTDATVNAYADRQGNTWSVHMFGGLARHPAITDDGLMLVVCHEIGHHIGGAPKYNGMGWAANEGQSDYFGVMKCMRRVLHDDNRQTAKRATLVDGLVQQKCNEAFRDDRDRSTCERVSMAGKSLADLFASMGGKPTSFSTPDMTVVSSTYDGHPKAQCRLDTYFQGSLCTKEFLDDMSETDPKRGSCIMADGFKMGVRPTCWYKPRPDELR